MNVCLVLHAHQPPGNFDSVFEHGFEVCYGPVLDLIEERPDLRLSMHWSGSLLEWTEKHRPGRIDQIRRLVQRGQVEVVAAGMYEPVLSLLPKRDRVGQLKAHRAYLERLFGVDATTGWLTERVWEPSLASDLAEGGIRAVTLDDRHFFSAGLADEDLDVPYLTEHQGAPIVVAPGRGEMRAAIPWMPVDEAIDVIQRRADDGAEVLVYGDDIEKFGMWPGTHRSVIRGRWLARFLDGLAALQRERDDIRVVPLGEAAEGTRRPRRIYIPDGSYPEMLDWSLTADAQRRISQVRGSLSEAGLLERLSPYIRQGLYFQFLAKYPEVNHLHKRMLDVSRRVERLLPRRGPWDPQALPAAVRELWRAQANCAYWHGLFGGVYLPHIRQQLWFHLLRAEDALEAERGAARVLRRFDLDADREDEFVVTTPELITVIDPSEGVIVELSHRPSGVNLGDTLARREEAYHETGAAAPYPYDRGRRGIFVDRFLPAGRPPARTSAVQDLGDFAGQPYEARARRRADLVEVSLTRTADAAGSSVRVDKTLRVATEEPTVEASYRIAPEDGELEARVAVEVNLAMLFRERRHGQATLGDRQVELPRGGAARGVTSAALAMDDIAVGVGLAIEPPADIDIRPIETVSRSEGGFERSAQELAVLVSWPLRLVPGETFEATVRLSLLEVAR